MIIDDLLIYKRPLKYRLTLQKPNGDSLANLPESFNINFSCSLKDINNFTFTLPYYIDNYVNPNFNLIRTGFQVFVELYSEETEIVFMEDCFQITNIENSDNNGEYTKNITCKALQVQLSKKILKQFEGTKTLYRTQADILAFVPDDTYKTLDDYINSGVLNVITALNPSWTIDESAIDEDLLALYRYFDIDNMACLDFLLNDVQTSYMCVLQFNNIDKTIGARNLTHLGVFRGLFLSDNNLITNHIEEINDDDITTRLFIYGKDQLTIRGCNPTGEEYILDLSYYRNTTYMSQPLLNSLDAYDILLENKEGEFATLLTNLNSHTSALSVQQSDLVILRAELAALEIQLNELITEGANLTIKHAEITAKNNEINAKEIEITTTQDNINIINASIELLQSEILMTNNFTIEQIEELDQFIKDKEVIDDTFTNIQELYDEGKRLIEKINQPTIQFEVDIIDLYDCVESQLEWGKLSVGDIGAIKHEPFNTDVQLRLIGYVHDYENNKLTLTFGNKNNLNDPNMLINDIKSTISTTTTLDINKYKYLDYLNSGDKTMLNNYITGLLDLATQGAIAGANQEVTINQKGITLSNPAYPQKQVRLMHNGIYFTIDGWQTSEIALTSENGVVAEAIRGVLGQFCTVQADRLTVGSAGEQIPDSLIESADAWNGVAIDLNNAINTINSDMTDLQSALEDDMIVTYYQDIEPDAKLGDLWFDTSTGKLHRHNGTAFDLIEDADIITAIDIAQNAIDTADGKIVSYYQITQPTDGNEGDLWINTAEGNRLYRYNGTTWQLANDNNSLQQDVFYNQVTINPTDGIKALHPADGSYTQMNGDGFVRKIAEPVYAKTPTGMPNKETFIGKTRTDLETDGWVFSNPYGLPVSGELVTAEELVLPNAYVARVYRAATQDNAVFKITYRMTTTNRQEYYLIIDGSVYTLPYSTTLTTYTTTLSKGMHCFMFDNFRVEYGNIAVGTGVTIYIKEITFEESPVVYSPIDTVVGESEYNYITYVGRGSSGHTQRFDPEAVPDVYIQLPDRFKGKDFEVFAFLQDTGAPQGNGTISSIDISVLEIDRVNARFVVRARMNMRYPFTGYSGSLEFFEYYTGCDFTYVVTH